MSISMSNSVGPAGAVGVVAFSFALRDSDLEPNPCNRRLAEQVRRIVTASPQPAIVVAQWEVARALNELGVDVTTVVNGSSDKYLDSEEVWDRAKQTFAQQPEDRGVTDVILVANPFLHLRKVRGMARRDHYSVLDERVGRVGFDKSSLNRQWWTRGPVRLLAYAAAQVARIPFASRRHSSALNRPAESG